MNENEPSLDTLLAQGGHFVDRETGAIVPPIHPATTFARNRRYELTGFGYSRNANPTGAEVEKVLARLEGAEEALVFASGLAGVAAFFETVRAGERVVAPRVMYHGTADWLRRLAERRGVEVAFFDATAPGALAAAVEAGDTSVVWIEPSVNPTWDVIDVRAAAAAAHAAGAVLGVDATVTPAVTLRAIDLGADVVFHSGTKYLAGHSDVMAGVLATRAADERWEEVKLARTLTGGVLGAFEAWLLLRGMRTLHVRYERQAANALAIARHFERHRAVEGVLYPGLESHPGHAVAKRQMNGGFGAMLSLLVPGGADGAKRVATRTRSSCPRRPLAGSRASSSTAPPWRVHTAPSPRTSCAFPSASSGRTSSSPTSSRRSADANASQSRTPAGLPRAEPRVREGTGFGVLAVGNGEADVPLLSHVPFIVAEDGAAVHAHLVRANPIARLLAAGERPAVLAVSGPDGYVSPDWYGAEPDQVPTWNYVAVHLRGTLRLRPRRRFAPTSTRSRPGSRKRSGRNPRGGPPRSPPTGSWA